MIYIVSGDGPRCGSSMLMQALMAGGMPAGYDRASEQHAQTQAYDDYDPNPGGRFELLTEHQHPLGFPDPARFDGWAIKLFSPPWGTLAAIVPGDYRIAWLHRPAPERWESFFRAHRKKPLLLVQNREKPIVRTLMAYRDGRGRETLAIMRQRRDVVSITELDYATVCADPGAEMAKLADAGWPIDVGAAAKVPTQAHHRIRIA